MELLEAYRNGKSVEELSSEMGIPADRIEVRLRAAEAFLERSKEHCSGGDEEKSEPEHGVLLRFPFRRRIPQA